MWAWGREAFAVSLTQVRSKAGEHRCQQGTLTKTNDARCAVEMGGDVKNRGYLPYGGDSTEGGGVHAPGTVDIPLLLV